MFVMLEDFLKQSKIKSRRNVPLSHYTTMEVGGITPLMIFPHSSNELIELLEYLKGENIPYFVIGKGSNLIVNDEGVDLIFINTQQLNQITLIDEDTIQVESGASLKDLSEFAYINGLTGLEFACGIPGTVGGAVFMNAGAYDGEIKDVLKESLVFDQEKKVLNNAEHQFSYRKSIFTTAGATVISSTFILPKNDKSIIKQKIDDLTEQRTEKQPLEFPSAGSTFKRPQGHFTGKLITDAGLKGFRIGGAGVSDKHAGFIVNVDNAKAQDILDLITHIQKTVKEQFNVLLEPEVKFLEKNGSFKNFTQ